VKYFIFILFVIPLSISCSAPGKPLATDSRSQTSAQGDEDFDPSPYDEEWPEPTVVVEHDIPEALLKVEEGETG